ncbi:MAG: LysM peptidoglycan-binding domain-containing protein [Deltaproteobacteria bacterium]|nr:LysM peptidoglycan-binding domain-containing protein [Deltaproteobacteria bacterium]
MTNTLKAVGLLCCLLVFGCAQLEKGYQDTKKAVFPEETKPKAAAKASEAKKTPEPEKPKESPASPPASVRESTAAPAKPHGEEFIPHKVASGETLATIAKWYCGKTSAWREIAASNPGLDPSRLKEGQIIKIPAAIATVRKEPPEHPSAGGPGPTKKTAKDKDKDASEGPPAPEAKPVFGPK